MSKSEFNSNTWSEISKHGLPFGISLWTAIIILDYFFHHSYYAHAFFNFPYFGLCFLLISVCGIANFLINRFLSAYLKGWMIYGFLLLLSTILIGVYGLKNELFEDSLITHLGHFYFKIIPIHASLLIILITCFAFGNLIIQKANLNLLKDSSNILKTAIGLSFWTVLLVILGLFDLLQFWIIWGAVISILVWQYKAVFQFLKSLFWNPIIINHSNWLTQIPIFLLLIFIAFNSIGALKIFPIGNDGALLYQYKSHLIGTFGALPEGGPAFNWSVFMSLGEILFESETISMMLSHSAGILVIWVLCRIARLFVSRNKAWLAALIFYVIPAVSFHNFKDEKTDLGFLFITLSVVLLILEFYKNKKSEFTQNQENQVWILAGWLTGFAFGIKYLAIFSFIALLGFLFYKKGGSKWAIGSWFIALGSLFGLNIYKFGHIEIGRNESLGIALGLIVTGLLFLLLKDGKLDFSKFKKTLPFRPILLFSFCFTLAFLPWGMKHISENQSLSVQSVIEGKANQNDLKTGIQFLARNDIEISNESQQKLNTFLAYLKQKNVIDASMKIESLTTPQKVDIWSKHRAKHQVGFRAKQRKNRTPNTNDIREEITRYLGYEKGLPLYLSLPYDLTMNTNIHGRRYLDIGFLFLLLIPIWFFSGRLKTIFGRLGRILFAFFAFFLSLYSLGWEGSRITEKIDFFRSFQPEGFDAVFGGLYAFLTSFLVGTANFFQPVFNLLSGLSFWQTLLGLAFFLANLARIGFLFYGFSFNFQTKMAESVSRP